jgi:hypothetical protein
MPVEVRELIIRAVVTSSDQRTAPSRTEMPSTTPAQMDIVQECVRQVLLILKKQKER